MDRGFVDTPWHLIENSQRVIRINADGFPETVTVYDCQIVTENSNRLLASLKFEFKTPNGETEKQLAQHIVTVHNRSLQAESAARNEAATFRDLTRTELKGIIVEG